MNTNTALKKRFLPRLPDAARGHDIPVKHFYEDFATAELAARKTLIEPCLVFLRHVLCPSSHGKHPEIVELTDALTRDPYPHIQYHQRDDCNVFDIRAPKDHRRTLLGIRCYHPYFKDQDKIQLSVEAPDDLRTPGAGVRVRDRNNSSTEDILKISRTVTESRNIRVLHSSEFKISADITSTTKVSGGTPIGGEVEQSLEVHVGTEYGEGKENEETTESSWSYTFESEKHAAPGQGFEMYCTWDEQVFVERWLLWGVLDWQRIVLDVPNLFLTDAWRENRQGIGMGSDGYHTRKSWSGGTRIEFAGTDEIVRVCRGNFPNLNPVNRPALINRFTNTDARTNCIGSLVVREEGMNFNQTTKDI